MPKTIALIHASRAAVEPVMTYYAREAPEFDYVNLLEDGIMHVLDAGDQSRPHRRLLAMIETARDEYGAAGALVTCSALRRETLARLRESAGIPIVKIDEPMAREAVEAGPRIGVVVTFPPTAAVTRRLLEEAAADAGKRIELIEEVSPEALQALLAGDLITHDTMLATAVHRCAGHMVDAIVLAQVSMARLGEELRDEIHTPIFTSLPSSLAEIRRVAG